MDMLLRDETKLSARLCSFYSFENTLHLVYDVLGITPRFDNDVPIFCMYFDVTPFFYIQ